MAMEDDVAGNQLVWLVVNPTIDTCDDTSQKNRVLKKGETQKNCRTINTMLDGVIPSPVRPTGLEVCKTACPETKRTAPALPNKGPPVQDVGTLHQTKTAVRCRTFFCTGRSKTMNCSMPLSFALKRHRILQG